VQHSSTEYGCTVRKLHPKIGSPLCLTQQVSEYVWWRKPYVYLVRLHSTCLRPGRAQKKGGLHRHKSGCSSPTHKKEWFNVKWSTFSHTVVDNQSGGPWVPTSWQGGIRMNVFMWGGGVVDAPAPLRSLRRCDGFLTRPLVCAISSPDRWCVQGYLSWLVWPTSVPMFWHTESTTCSAGNNWSKKDFSILPTFTDKLCQKLKFRGLKFGRSGFPQWMFWAASCKPIHKLIRALITKPVANLIVLSKSLTYCFSSN